MVIYLLVLERTGEAVVILDAFLHGDKASRERGLVQYLFDSKAGKAGKSVDVVVSVKTIDVDMPPTGDALPVAALVDKYAKYLKAYG